MMHILDMTDEELDEKMLDNFIAAWNRTYGGLGGRMTRERIDRVAALYPAPHEQDIKELKCSSLA